MLSNNLADLLEDRSSMTKRELVHYLAFHTGLTKVEIETVVGGFLSTIQDALKLGKKVELRGFGTFTIRTREPREARNPATQEKVLLGRRFVPVFRPSKTFRTEIDQARMQQAGG